MEKNRATDYLQAGYGEIDITPPLGTDLAGFGFYLDRRATIVRDRLKARSLCLQGKEETILILSLDLLSLSVDFADRCRRQISRETGIPFKNILLACTHTHSGPAVQPLPGLGKINREYVRRLSGLFLEAARKARANLEEAEVGFQAEAVEPIGYNRRLNSFSPIDPWLKTGIFKQKKRTIFLLNYACHAVTLGPTKEISSDWPGAAVNEIERSGNKALVLQGFCGDIDPVTYLNRRLGATREDYYLSGRIIAARALKSVKYTKFRKDVVLKSAENRIRLPLSVFPWEDLERETAAALEANQQFLHAARVISLWRKKIEKHYKAFASSPWLENVPVQAIRVGEMRILCLPGEAFCSLGLKLREKFPSLMTAGYANGDVGYLPTEEAYLNPDDYACYCAPKFYGLFNFAPAVEKVLIEESSRVLSSI
ncbi:MAG: hypothetical protein WC524_08065 [Candidatus Aminicenantales bacterium]|nr:hypothetical protein [Acidobacteriota bacterium]